jgi:hypothetical protein
MTTTPRLGIELVDDDEILGYVSVNEAMVRLDVLAQTTVLSRSVSAPPGAAAEGALYIVGPAPTGAWTGHVNDLTELIGGVWVFVSPEEGWVAGCKAENIMLWFDGATWQAFSSGGGGGSSRNFDMSGADPTPADLPNQYGTFRYASGGAITFFCNDGGVIKRITIGEPSV